MTELFAFISGTKRSHKQGLVKASYKIIDMNFLSCAFILVLVKRTSALRYVYLT